MRFRKPRLMSMVAVGTAVLVLAMTLLVGRGVIDALVLILIVAALTGMYQLRRYARAELLYRRRDELLGQPSRTEPESEPVSSGSAEATGN
jgi:hypothetical protein